MSAVTPPPIPQAMPAASPLSPEHIRLMGEARNRGKKIRRAVGWATFEGWTLVTFAALTVLMSLTSPSGLAVGAGLGLVGMIELRAAGRLRRLERGAARQLGFNQLLLGGVLMVYAAWKIYEAYTGPVLSPELSAPEVRQALGTSMEDMARTIYLVIYGGVIAMAIFAQGGTALFYFSRERLLEKYLAETPGWIVEMQRAGIAV